MTLVVRTEKGYEPAQRKAWPLAGTGNRGITRQNTAIELLAEGGYSVNYYQLYRGQPWVYTVVNKLARSIASLPLKTYTINDRSGRRERDRTSRFARLIREPMPPPSLSTFQLILGTVASLYVYGNALWVKYRPAGYSAPTELWPVSWRNVEVVTGEQQPINAYNYRSATGTKSFLPDEVVHFKWWSEDGIIGVSPLEPLALTLLLEDAGRRYAAANFVNAARPSSAIINPRPMNTEQREELRSEIRRLYGGPDNAFSVAILDGGVDWKPLSHTAAEAQTIEHRLLNREEVCAVLDVNPAMVHVNDKQALGTAKEVHDGYYMDTLAAPCGLVEAVLKAQLVQPDEVWFPRSYAKFDLDAPMRGNISERSQAYQRFQQAGVYSQDELRALEDLEPIGTPESEAVWAPANMDPIGKNVEFRPAKPAPQPFAPPGPGGLAPANGANGSQP